MFDPKVHECSIPFDGSAAAAFHLARTALLSQGFEVVSESEDELRARGPGMHSNQQSPLLGVTDFRLQVGSGSLHASSILGGVASLSCFVTLFPPCLVIGLWGLLRLLDMDVPWTMTLFALPWVVIGPLISGSLERKTMRAVENLVRGMAQMRPQPQTAR